MSADKMTTQSLVERVDKTTLVGLIENNVKAIKTCRLYTKEEVVAKVGEGSSKLG